MSLLALVGRVFLFRNYVRDLAWQCSLWPRQWTKNECHCELCSERKPTEAAQSRSFVSIWVRTNTHDDNDNVIVTHTHVAYSMLTSLNLMAWWYYTPIQPYNTTNRTRSMSTTRAHNRPFRSIFANQKFFLGLQIVGNMTLKSYIKNQLYG